MIRIINRCRCPFLYFRRLQMTNTGKKQKTCAIWIDRDTSEEKCSSSNPSLWHHSSRVLSDTTEDQTVIGWTLRQSFQPGSLLASLYNKTWHINCLGCKSFGKKSSIYILRIIVILEKGSTLLGNAVWKARRETEISCHIHKPRLPRVDFYIQAGLQK